MNDKYNIQELYEDDVETCKNCGNVFRVELIQKSSDYNDFGFRYCPFCGTMIDEWAHIKHKC
jgi:hypothetical protein